MKIISGEEMDFQRADENIEEQMIVEMSKFLENQLASIPGIINTRKTKIRILGIALQKAVEYYGGKEEIKKISRLDLLLRVRKEVEEICKKISNQKPTDTRPSTNPNTAAENELAKMLRKAFIKLVDAPEINYDRVDEILERSIKDLYRGFDPNAKPNESKEIN